MRCLLLPPPMPVCGWLPIISAVLCATSLLLQRPVNELQQLKDNVLCSWVSRVV